MAQSLSMFVDGVSNTELLSNNCKGQQWPVNVNGLIICDITAIF